MVNFNGSHPESARSLAPARADSAAGYGGERGVENSNTNPSPLPPPPSAHARGRVDEIVEDRWPDLNAQGWRNPDAAIRHYTANVDKLERDLGLADKVRKSKHPEMDRIEPTSTVAPWHKFFELGKQIQRLHAEGRTAEQIQEQTSAPDGDQWAMETIERWSAVPFGTTPSIRATKLFQQFG